MLLAIRYNKQYAIRIKEVLKDIISCDIIKLKKMNNYPAVPVMTNEVLSQHFKKKGSISKCCM